MDYKAKGHSLYRKHEGLCGPQGSDSGALALVLSLAGEGIKQV